MAKTGKAHTPRNFEVARGISRYSPGAMFRKRGVWALKKKATTAAKDKTVKPITKQFGKKGQTRTVYPRGPSSYPTADAARTRAPKKNHPVYKRALRSSITPGTVLILVAGKYMGKRVVFLKQLDSGLLLVTGPVKINGVPLGRIDQAYVIATSTKVDISGVKVPESVNDAYFTKKAEKKPKTEAQFFADEKKEKTVEKRPERVANQKAVDASIVAAIKKDKALKGYLSSTFSLKNGQFPHQLKF
eukprot:TRINITY_DN22157_c0_g1_i1.p1 TRINITY_DN22157_c0_g1~~TRINITY_DN22157_c0_g1_i1.p1  ORF type:complete len:245 (-),score=53.27 TRINITY_DN22157_c0_g1_i1:35-769(-)